MDRAETQLSPSEPRSCAPPRWYGVAMWLFTALATALIAVLALLWIVHVYMGSQGHLWQITWPEAMYQTTWYSLGAIAICVAILLAFRIGRGKWIERPPTWAWLIGLIVLAGVLRAATMAIPYEPCADFQVYHQAGVDMAQRWTLGIPASATQQGGYRCFYPPGQVFSLGVMYDLLGKDFSSGQVLNVVLSTLTVLGMWYLSYRLFGMHVGRVCSILAALLPSTVFGCMLLGAEVPETFWIVLALCLYAALIEPRQMLWPALLCGLCLGIGALIRPTYLLLPIPIGLHMLISWKERRKALLTAAIMLVGVLLAVLPWTYRNYRVTGGFVLISSNGGGNLYSANNDNAQGDYTESAWQYVYDHAKNDLELNSVGMKMATDWIRGHPGRFVDLMGIKFIRFWCTDKEIAWWALEQPSIDQEKRRNEQAKRTQTATATAHGVGAVAGGLLGPVACGVVVEAAAAQVVTEEAAASVAARGNGQISIPWQAMEYGKIGSDAFYLVCLAAGVIGLWRFRRELISSRTWIVIPVLCMYFTAIHMVFESQGKYHYMLVPLLLVFTAMAVSPRPKESCQAERINTR